MEECKVIFNPFTREYLQSFLNGDLFWTDEIGQCYLFANNDEFKIALQYCGDMEEEQIIEVKTVYYNG